MKSFILLLFFSFTAFSVIGCATPEKKAEVTNVFWPRPPDPTRVRYITSVISDLDVRPKTRQEKVFGNKPNFVLRKPADVVVDKRDNVYVSDLANVLVATFNLEKQTANILPIKGFHNPLGLAYNEKLDWLAVVSPTGKEVMVYQLPDLSQKVVINNKSGVELLNPVDAAIDAERGRIYVSDSKAGYIRVYDLEGKYQSDIGRPGRDRDGLFAPAYLTLDKDGNIYVVELFGCRFHVFSPEGKTLATVGELGTGIGDFSRPKGIALDQDGHIFVADAAFGNVQIFDLKGNVYLFFGTNGKLPGNFQIPEGMYIDKNNRLYVADQRNRRIQIFQIYSDDYYKQHPEEASKFSEPAVTILPEEKKEGIVNAPSETTPESTEEQPVTEESQPTDNGAGTDNPMIEESQPSNGNTNATPAPAEEDPFDQEIE